MVGAGRVAGGRAHASVFFQNQVVVGPRFVGGVAPEFAAHPLVQVFGKGLGKSVGQRLEQDRVVVVVIRLKHRNLFFHLVTGGDGKPAEVVGDAGFLRRDPVGQTQVGPRGRLVHLLAQEVEGLQDGGPAVVGVDLDIVTHRIGRPESKHRTGGDPFVCDDVFQHGLGVVEQLLRFAADDLVVKNFRIQTRQFPRGEKRRPVDALDQFFQRIVGEGFDAGKRGFGRHVGFPIGRMFARPRLLQGQPFFARHLVALDFADAFILRGDLRLVRRTLVVAQQLAHHAHHARRVGHVDDRFLVLRGDLDRGVHLRGRGTADQQRNVESFALHLGGDMDHFVERRRDQSAEADDIAVFFLRGAQDFFARHHDPDVDDLVVVALQHHADNVFADVVHVAFDRGHQDAALDLRRAGLFRLFKKRLEIRHRFFHHARAFHHLRQEHFARTKQVADHVHSGHQRAFDHFQRMTGALAHLLGVDIDEVGDALDERVGEAFAHRQAAPGLGFFGDLFLAAVVAGNFEQPLGGVGAFVQHEVFDAVAQFRRDVVVYRELSRVDDAHVHAGLDRVVEKHRMNRLAHRFVAAERKGDVADAAADADQRHGLFDLPRRLDEGHAVSIVFLNAGADGEHVVIENNVFGRETDHFGQNLVRTRTDVQTPLQRVGLAVRVERHDDHRRAIQTRFFRLLDERLFAFLHADGIHHAFALHAFQAGFDDFPFG